MVAPETTHQDITDSDTWTDQRRDLPWHVVVWDDPINLMVYVTYVFQKLFNFSKEKAHRLMMEVHTTGKAIVATESREKAELDVMRLHSHGLWATMEQQDG
ncbi:MAG: ATP-dependent Clp protease adapter ClpS [Acidimicrobiales bacterium]|nr:ATP-dependent Clp protease adapter ClpS [Acidimicrobiales bacterium]